jgi:hypothetical protein
MHETSRVRIRLSELTSIAARFLIATWRGVVDPPALHQDDEHLTLEFRDPGGLAQAVEALRAAESHGGGFGESALALRREIERILKPPSR